MYNKGFARHAVPLITTAPPAAPGVTGPRSIAISHGGLCQLAGENMAWCLLAPSTALAQPGGGAPAIQVLCQLSPCSTSRRRAPQGCCLSFCPGQPLVRSPSGPAPGSAQLSWDKGATPHQQASVQSAPGPSCPPVSPQAEGIAAPWAQFSPTPSAGSPCARSTPPWWPPPPRSAARSPA